MAQIGYHASHEQFAPSQLLQLAQQAEKAGFQFCLSSDHFHPWSGSRGQSGFSWSWLGAAMAGTSIPFGVVTCPVYRYHPAIIAQAAATLDEMFPGRFFLCAGSGQALNEAITGERWPAKEERNQRLKEGVQMIRALWTGEETTQKGLVQVEQAKLYTKPRTDIPIIGAALTEETARWAGTWADGLISVAGEPEQTKTIIDAFRSNGGKGRPVLLKVQVSFAKDRKKALEGAYDQWKTNVFGSKAQADLRSPAQYDELAKTVRPEDMEKHVLISNDPHEYIDRLRQYFDLGAEKLSIHNVNRDQEGFIDFFGREVLPGLEVNTDQ